MLNFNKVIVAGRLTANPRFHTFEGGKKKVNIRIASNREWTGDNGEKKKDTLFINCEAWGNKAERISNWFKVGRPILVEGRLEHQKEWTNKEGKIIKEMMINVSNWEFVDDKDSGNNGDSIPESSENCESEETTPEDFDALVEKAVNGN